MIEVLTPVAALVAGLAGSAHCMLMCGGIAGALGLGSSAGQACAGGSLRYPILYNLGRVTSYTAAGAVAGMLGGGTLALAGLPRLRKIESPEPRAYQRTICRSQRDPAMPARSNSQLAGFKAMVRACWGLTLPVERH